VISESDFSFGFSVSFSPPKRDDRNKRRSPRIPRNAAPAAELFYLLGEYCEMREQKEEAVFWYKRAAFEAECYVCITYGGEFALRNVIRLLEEQGHMGEATQYAKLLEQEAHRF
jgi:hypothetical protein